jgi:hypothetical protein
MADFVGYIAAALFVGALLGLLWAMVRFGVIGCARTRGARERLRQPDAAGVSALCGVVLSPDVEALYRDSALVEGSDLALVDERATPPVRWPVEQFIPLTPRDVREWRTITGVPGVPIAIDSDKGCYYIASDGSVRLASPNVRDRDIPVAASVTDFFALPIDTSEESGT